MKPWGRRSKNGDGKQWTYGVKDVGDVVRVRVELVEQSLDVFKEVQDEF